MNMWQLAPRHDIKPRENTEPSKTVPDQTMSIRTILEKYARGENFNGKVPIYTEEDNQGIDIRRLDLSEIHELKLQNEKDIQRMQDDLASKRSKQAAEDMDKRIQSAAKLLMEQNAAGGKEATPTTNPL